MESLQGLSERKVRRANCHKRSLIIGRQMQIDEDQHLFMPHRKDFSYMKRLYGQMRR